MNVIVTQLSTPAVIRLYLYFNNEEETFIYRLNSYRKVITFVLSYKSHSACFI